MANGNSTDSASIASDTADTGSGTQPEPPPPPPSEETGRRLRELHDIGDKTPEDILNEQ